MSAPQEFTMFGKNKNNFKLNDFVSANLRMSLHTNSFAPNVNITGQSLYSELTNEIANGQGYTTGGIPLTGTVSARSILGVAQTNGFKLSSGDAVWTASGTGIPAFRYAVMYYLGTLWGIVNPLIGYILCDSTPADIPLTATGYILTIACPQDGWFDIV